MVYLGHELSQVSRLSISDRPSLNGHVSVCLLQGLRHDLRNLRGQHMHMLWRQPDGVNEWKRVVNHHDIWIITNGAEDSLHMYHVQDEPGH